MTTQISKHPSERGEMSWQYRLYQHDNGEIELIEAVYEGEALTGWTETFLLRSESVNQLREVVLGWMRDAFDKVVLSPAAFGMTYCCDEHKAEKEELDEQ